MKCAHANYTVVDTRCFVCAVARDDDENRRAHGNVCGAERCVSCGAERQVNVNQRWREEGPWGPSATEQQRAAEAAWVRRLAAWAERQAAAPARLRAQGVTARARDKGAVDIEVDISGDTRTHKRADIVRAIPTLEPEVGEVWLDVLAAAGAPLPACA